MTTILPCLAPPPATERDLALLRLLGRLEFATAAQLRRIIAPDGSRMLMWRRLADLHERRLIWRQAVAPQLVPSTYQGGSPPPRPPVLYGLTPRGQEYLAAQRVEEDPTALDLMRVRSARRPDLKTGQLAHDTLVVEWVSSLLAEVVRSRRLASVRLELEYISAVDRHGQATQRFDALVVLAFATSDSPLPLRPSWAIPWWEGQRAYDDDQMLILAAEVDRGTEQLATLLGKAVTYRDLTVTGHYQRILGGNPVPIVLAPRGRRVRQIAQEWADGWPGGVGLIASFQGAVDRTYGAWGGSYYDLTESTPVARPLWTLLDWSQAEWDTHRTITP